jgi:hypothetical protein
LRDYVLWYPKGQKEHVGKFKSRWLGPYRIQYRLTNNTALLVTVAHFEPNPIIVNINKLKSYRFYADQQPVTIEPQKSSKGLDDQQKGDSVTTNRVGGQTTQTAEVQGAKQHILAEQTKEAEQKSKAVDEERQTEAEVEKEKIGKRKIW